VQHLVSSAVPGLAAEDVAVVDADGTLLSASTQATPDQAASDYEKDVQARVQAMLDRIVGTGHATVAVSAVIDKESAQRTSETFTSPTEDGLALQESTSSEVYGPGANTPGATGVLGPDNIAVPSATESEGYSNTTVERINAIDKVTEVRTIPAGSLVRQSVSIAIDAAAAEGLKPSAIESLVAAAAGIDPARGDAITVEVVAFAVANAETAAAAIEAAKAAEAEQNLHSLVQTGIVAGAIALVVVVGIVVLARSRKRARPDAVDVGAVPASPVGPTTLDEVDDQPVVTGFTAPPQVTAVDPGFDPEPDSELARARAAVDALAAADPQRTAEYLRRLMDEPAGAR